MDKVVRESRTTATLQVVVNPPLRPGSKIHDRTYEELRKLGADYVRYRPLAALSEARRGRARAARRGQNELGFYRSIDPMTIDFLNATAPAPGDPQLQHHPAVDVQDR